MHKLTYPKTALYLMLSAVLIVILYPSDAWATLGQQLEKVNTLVTGQLMKTGIVGGSIIGFIVAILKGSIKMAFMIIGVGVAFAYFLGWVKSGDFAV